MTNASNVNKNLFPSNISPNIQKTVEEDSTETQKGVSESFIGGFPEEDNAEDIQIEMEPERKVEHKSRSRSKKRGVQREKREKKHRSRAPEKPPSPQPQEQEVILIWCPFHILKSINYRMWKCHFTKKAI